MRRKAISLSHQHFLEITKRVKKKRMIKLLGNYLEFNSYFYKNLLKILEHNIRNKNKEIKKKRVLKLYFRTVLSPKRPLRRLWDFPKKNDPPNELQHWPPKKNPSCGKDAPAEKGRWNEVLLWVKKPEKKINKWGDLIVNIKSNCMSTSLVSKE